MIRKVTFLFVFFLLSIVLVFYFFKKEGNPTEKTLGIKQEIVFKKVRGFENIYNFDYLVVSPDRVFLYSNLDGLSGKELKSKYDCVYLVSGGFYNLDFKPIGLLLSENEELSSWQKNRLLNGIFSINKLGTPRITRFVPQDPLRLALQAGPLVFENGTRVSLKSSVAFERRVVVGVTGDNNPVFLVFWSENNSFGGPALEELPYLIEAANESFDLNIADALNLDGGTASIFYGESVNLTEANKVGSFFCVR